MNTNNESIKRPSFVDPSSPGSPRTHAGTDHQADFQQYHSPMLRAHHVGLHDWGIARGLEVDGTQNASDITINSGIAIDAKGNLISLAESGKANIGKDTAGNRQEVTVPVKFNLSRFSGQTGYLTIEFSEIYRTTGGPGGSFEQIPWIRLQPVTGAGAYEDNGTSIILAIAVIDATGKLAELKEKDPNLSFRRRLIGESIEELRFRRATKDDDGVKEIIDTVLSPFDGGGLQASILGKPALQLFAPAQKNTYLTLLNPNGQQAIQLDTTTGAGSIRIKNTEGKGIGAFQAADEGGGLLRLYNKTDERATVEILANGGESGVVRLFGADGSVSIELTENGISTRFLSVKDIAGTSTASIFSDGSMNLSGSLNTFGGISTSASLSSGGAIFSNSDIQAQGNIFLNQLVARNTIFTDINIQAKGGIFADGNVQAKGTIFTDINIQAKGTIFADGNIQAKGGIFADGNIQAQGNIFLNQLVARGTIFTDADVQAKGTIFANGNVQAQGDIFGRTKNFLIDHPHDRTKNIIYTAIEGPESAAYIRGKSQLVNGQVEIEFPEHFSLVVNPETITIQLTPRSAESKGLAVVSHSERGFSVKELWQGEGNYEFDYFVAGVRRGMEHFTPVVDKGFTAFGEPMGMSISGSAAVAPATPMFQENAPAASAQPEPLSPPAPQSVILADTMPEPPLPNVSPVPSPSAIDFEDKKP